MDVATTVTATLARLVDRRAEPAILLSARRTGFAPLAANPGFEALFGPGAGVEALGEGAGPARIRDALRAGRAASAFLTGQDRAPALGFLLPVLGGHGDPMCFLLAALPLPTERRAGGGLTAAAAFAQAVTEANAELAAERCPLVEDAALQRFDARAFVMARVDAV